MFQTEVVVNGKICVMVYKAYRPEEGRITTKLSLVEKAAYQTEEYKERIKWRRPQMIGYNHSSENDYVLEDGELAFKYMNIDLTKDPIDIRSNMEVCQSLRGRGLGKILFDTYEILAEDFSKRTSVVRGKTIRLLVRDNSDPKGWTKALAQKSGYVPFSDSEGFFETYTKELSTLN